MAKTPLDITLDELGRNWIVKEVDLSNLNKGAVLSPRFIVQQGEKSRTEPSMNSTVGTSEKSLQPLRRSFQGVDEIVLLIRQIFVTLL